MIYDTKVINSILKDTYIPKFIKVRQSFKEDKIENISFAIQQALSQKKITNTIKPGMKIAIACGSRGITNICLIIKKLADFIKEMGGEPFIVPAMGSHGGATADGQKKILEDMGITEDYCKCPILSSMETMEIGKTSEGEQVFIDKHAASADGIVIVGRIKPHTDFRAHYESGLMKMMAVGLGKQKGAENVHKNGPKYVGQRVELYGTCILQYAPIIFGVGLIENAYDETKTLVTLLSDEIKSSEPKLLKEAYESMAQILFHDIDILIVDEIGKEISGTGADPNITGSFATDCIKKGITRPPTIIFLDLTKATKGSAVGIGLCDITTKKLFDKIDFSKTYVNSITCNILKGSVIPIVMENDYRALQLGVYLNNYNDLCDLKIVRIKNTLNIQEVYISEALLSEALQNPQIEILEDVCKMKFDDNGNLNEF